ncbi:hypothetical protein JF66_12815 [Cryobacterium sp. MLB-32]|nr:hypothetical protein JF66_12815 [Cryobacterium sp. MLB-32]
MCRRSSLGLSESTSRPSMEIDPLVGSMMRLIIFMVVVLPHPLGPTNITSSPGCTVMEKLSTAATAWLGYCLVTLLSSMRAPLVLPEIWMSAVLSCLGTESL